LRAERLAAKGVLEMVDERDLSPVNLAKAVERAIAGPPAPISVDTRGAPHTARLLAAMITDGGRALHRFASPGAEDMIRR